MGKPVRRGDGAFDETMSNAAAVTPHDTNELTNYSRRIYVGGTGNLAVRLVEQASGSVTFSSVPVGWHPIAAKLVLSTGTTATNIVAAW